MVAFCFFFCFAEKPLLKEKVIFVHLQDYIFLRCYRIKETNIFHFFVLSPAIRKQKHQYNLELSFAGQQYGRTTHGLLQGVMKAVRPVFEELASRRSCKDSFCPRNLLFMLHLAACIDFAFEKYFSFFLLGFATIFFLCNNN